MDMGISKGFVWILVFIGTGVLVVVSGCRTQVEGESKYMSVLEAISKAKENHNKEVWVSGYLSSPPVLLYEGENYAKEFSLDESIGVSLLGDSNRSILFNLECLNSNIIAYGVFEYDLNHYSKKLKNISLIKSKDGKICYEFE